MSMGSVHWEIVSSSWVGELARQVRCVDKDSVVSSGATLVAQQATGELIYYLTHYSRLPQTKPILLRDCIIG